MTLAEQKIATLRQKHQKWLKANPGKGGHRHDWLAKTKPDGMSGRTIYGFICACGKVTYEDLK